MPRRSAGCGPAGRGASTPSSGAGGVDGARADAVAVRADVREALAGLGYETEEILAVLRDLPEAGDPAALLRDALQRLAVGARSG